MKTVALLHRSLGQLMQVGKIQFPDGLRGSRLCEPAGILSDQAIREVVEEIEQGRCLGHFEEYEWRANDEC